MNSYSPYQVSHIWLNQLDQWPLFSARSLYYFWYKERPIAHSWFDQALTQEDFQQHVLSACAKAQDWTIGEISNFEN
jgi:hypothetical protein